MFLTFFPSRILAGPSMIGIKSPMTSKFPKNSDQTSSDLIFFAQLLHFLVLKKGRFVFTKTMKGLSHRVIKKKKQCNNTTKYIETNHIPNN